MNCPGSGRYRRRTWGICRGDKSGSTRNESDVRRRTRISRWYMSQRWLYSFQSKATGHGVALSNMRSFQALLHSSHLYWEATQHFGRHGVVMNGEISMDIAQMMKQKRDAVEGLTKGIEMLFKKNKANKPHVIHCCLTVALCLTGHIRQRMGQH